MATSDEEKKVREQELASLLAEAKEKLKSIKEYREKMGWVPEDGKEQMAPVESEKEARDKEFAELQAEMKEKLKTGKAYREKRGW